MSRAWKAIGILVLFLLAAGVVLLGAAWLTGASAASSSTKTTFNSFLPGRGFRPLIFFRKDFARSSSVGKGGGGPWKRIWFINIPW